MVLSTNGLPGHSRFFAQSPPALLPTRIEPPSRRFWQQSMRSKMLIAEMVIAYPRSI